MMLTIKPYKKVKDEIQNQDSDYAKACRETLRKMMTPKKVPKKQEVIISTVEELDKILNYSQ
jgi:hypothetical protein